MAANISALRLVQIAMYTSMRVLRSRGRFCLVDSNGHGVISWALLTSGLDLGFG